LFKILILSNGHGEDLSGSLIAKQLVKSGYSVHALPIVGMGKYEIVTSGIGNPDDILKMKSVDKLPYRLQKKIFLPRKYLCIIQMRRM